MNTRLIIVGGGAAGLMAGATAAECGLPAIVVEHRHRAGLKLLMCGNNRCNLSNDRRRRDMTAAYGEPVAEFLDAAIRAFPPRELRRWFAGHGLETTVQAKDRIYPASLKADDVLHCFTDCLQNGGIPLMLNARVRELRRDADGFTVAGEGWQLRAPAVLLATGGVTYPKTGSVGDGQDFARTLGHRIEPYRPGLVGFEFAQAWPHRVDEATFTDVAVRTLAADATELALTRGEIVGGRRAVRGSALLDASRLIARHQWRDVRFVADLAPDLPVAELAARLRRGRSGWARILAALDLVPAALAGDFVREVVPREADADRAAAILKAVPLTIRHTRPLKEAMVTVGGVDRAEIDPASMESRRCPGLYFAGEVMDVDGPTGGFNLHAAFATARLAVRAVAAAD